MSTNQAADSWAQSQATARQIVDALDMQDGELICSWASEREDETQLDCGEQVAAEIRSLLPDGWTADTDEDGLVLRRTKD
jgi:hypothetical protein